MPLGVYSMCYFSVEFWFSAWHFILQPGICFCSVAFCFATWCFIVQRGILFCSVVFLVCHCGTLVFPWRPKTCQNVCGVQPPGVLQENPFHCPMWGATALIIIGESIPPPNHTNLLPMYAENWTFVGLNVWLRASGLWPSSPPPWYGPSPLPPPNQSAYIPTDGAATGMPSPGQQHTGIPI